jgi:glucose-1-phosphate adenylyltransferase
MHQTLTILLAGGGRRAAYPLTRNRAKRRRPFGGIYRIIDFTLSNCVNSGFCRRILVLTQYKYELLALQHHAGVELLHRRVRGVHRDHPDAQIDASTATVLSARRTRSTRISTPSTSTTRGCAISRGDHIYKMNYQKMAQRHREAGADLTVAALEVALARRGASRVRGGRGGARHEVSRRSRTGRSASRTRRAAAIAYHGGSTSSYAEGPPPSPRERGRGSARGLAP